MENQQATLKHIAEQLNISITTVSKALKGYSDVSESTKQKVKQLAEELHYTPNSFAVNLRTNQSKTIGLVIPEVVHHFFSSVIKGILSKAEEHDYSVIILTSNESIQNEKKQLELLLQKKVDGVLISLSNETHDLKHITEIIQRKIPLVLFDKISKLLPCTKILIDDQLAASQATQHLIDVGCKNIAHIRGPLNPQNSIDRFLGYKKTLEKNQIPFNKELVFTCNEVSFEEGYAFAKMIHENHPEVDGIFVITDLVACGVIKYCNDHQISIPDTYKIIGFSNWFMGKVITPTLSTINQPGFEMGQACFTEILEQIQCKLKGTTYHPITKYLPTEVIIRDSTL